MIFTDVLTPNFSKSKTDITKLISVHDSIIILLSFGTLFHSYLTMDGCTAVKFVKHVKIVFCPSWRCLRCMMAFAGAFTTKTVLTCFTTMIAEQPSLTQYERPIYNMKEKEICYHPLITISRFFFSILRDLGLNLGFLFFKLTLYQSSCKRLRRNTKLLRNYDVISVRCVAPGAVSHHLFTCWNPGMRYTYSKHGHIMKSSFLINVMK